MSDGDRRAFRREFLTHAHATKGWPVEENVKEWCDESGRPFMKNGVYSGLAKGGHSSARHLDLIVEFLLDSRHKNHVERQSLDKFLADRLASTATTKNAVLELISVAELVPDHGFGLGTRALHWFFEHQLLRLPGQFVRPVSNEEEAQDAAGAVYVDAGRQLAGHVVSPTEALRIVKTRMGLNIDQYQERVAMWWRHNPWTVVHATHRKRTGRLGTSITLPVTEAFVNEATSGKRATHECSCDDLQQVSPCLILEGVSAASNGESSRNPSLSLLAAVICQMAKLSDVPGVGRDPELRVVSFFGTPEGQKRLKGFGFRPLGSCFPGTSIEYAERRLGSRGRGFRDGPLVGIWHSIQLHMRDVYGPPRELTS